MGARPPGLFQMSAMGDRRIPQMSVLAATPDRATVVRAVCAREWREALGNRLLVGMTLLPPIVILFTGVLAVAAAANNPPRHPDGQALFAGSPPAAGYLPR